MDFHTKLICELTELDRRESKCKGYNIYALAHYLRAAEGVTDAESFARAFNPTRGMHRVARNMGLNLDVDRGEWVFK